MTQRLGLVEDDVVDFIVAVNEGSSVLWLVLLVFKVLQHLVNVRYLPHWFIRLYIARFCLCFADC